MNTPGRSLYVRLQGPDYGPGAAGKWTDAATGEHGDLLDLIALNRNLPRLGEAMDEARLFLALPRPAIASPPIRHAPPAAQRILRSRPPPVSCRPPGSRHAGRGLSARPRHHRTARLARACAITRRSITAQTEDAPLEFWPALLAAVTDLDGTITGIQRTWLDPTGPPRRRLPIRAGRSAICSATACASATSADILAAGEGIETMLALKSVLPVCR